MLRQDDEKVQQLACEMYVEHRGEEGTDAQVARKTWAKMRDNMTPKYSLYTEWARAALEALRRIERS